MSRRHLRYDPNDPPRRPPNGADPTLWELAYLLYREHEPDTNGMCIASVCKEDNRTWPCHGLRTAKDALVRAVWEVSFSPNVSFSHALASP